MKGTDGQTGGQGQIYIPHPPTPTHPHHPPSPSSIHTHTHTFNARALKSHEIIGFVLYVNFFFFQTKLQINKHNYFDSAYMMICNIEKEK